MFTGIIEAAGEIASLEEIGGDVRAVISSDELDFRDLKTGDSISVNGVCLTALDISENTFSVDISNETLALTSLANIGVGAIVNLEKAMQPSSRFGGHIVSGHVDGLAELVSRVQDGRSDRLVFSAPAGLMKYIAAKGSVCLEGISLTVNEVSGNTFGINIIPHTSAVTTLGSLEQGGKVNMEVDIISRYLESLLEAKDVEERQSNITLEKLAQYGFTQEPANDK